MTTTCARYGLQDGYIHNWLVLGPWIASGEEVHSLLADRFSDPVVNVQALEPATVDDGIVAFGDFEGRWQYHTCAEDHFVDLSDFTSRNPHAPFDWHLIAWAYAELEVPVAGPVGAVLTTASQQGETSASVWINGQPISDGELPGDQSPPSPRSSGLRLDLEVGRNKVLIRLEVVAMQPSALAVAFRVENIAATVCLPTAIDRVERRERLERVFRAAHLDRYVFAREDEIRFRWPSKDEPGSSFEDATHMTARLRSRSGRIYVETDRTAVAGDTVRLCHAYQQVGGTFDLVLMPRPQEYYEHGMRISRSIPLWSLGNNRYTESSSDTQLERRREALVSAARYDCNVYSEIAKMALGWWSFVDEGRLLRRIESLAPLSGRDHRELLGFLAMMIRYGEAPEFPESLRVALSEMLPKLEFSSLEDEALSEPAGEPSELLESVSEILAGQLCTGVRQDGGGWTGQQRCAHGERQALAWMRTVAAMGLRAWHSDTAFGETILALAHLTGFAEGEEVWQMATVLLDKLLFQLAVNSFVGVFGASRGTTPTAHLFGGHLGATSGITKLLWGQGVFNPSFAATVSLACLTEYEVPLMFRDIATQPPPEGLWSRERHGLGGVSTATFRTPASMLSAALDYRPGEPGKAEHIWQATLGPAATVFVTHPVASSLSDTWYPNFWRGNGVLPRVAQWRDALIVLYALPADDWMGFTHAYFPLVAFDEGAVRGRWAFARKGDGYLALGASQDLSLVGNGEAAYRELRVHGLHTVWLCQLGRASEDGDFAAFQAKVQALPITYGDLSVRWETLRGDTLALDWTGPFFRNGEPLSLAVENAVENPYCVAGIPTDAMEIRYGDVAMRLDFGTDHE